MNDPSIETRIKRSAILIGTGLGIQLLSLIKVHPLAFVVFLMLGCPLVLGGMLVYLASILSFQPRAEIQKAARAAPGD